MTRNLMYGRPRCFFMEAQEVSFTLYMLFWLLTFELSICMHRQLGYQSKNVLSLKGICFEKETNVFPKWRESVLSRARCLQHISFWATHSFHLGNTFLYTLHNTAFDRCKYLSVERVCFRALLTTVWSTCVFYVYVRLSCVIQFNFLGILGIG